MAFRLNNRNHCKELWFGAAALREEQVVLHWWFSAHFQFNKWIKKKLTIEKEK